MLEQYRTIYEGGQGEITEKKSRFIATVQSCEDRRGSRKIYRRDEKEVLGRYA